MLRNVRLVLAVLIAVAFMASGWATVAAAATECMGCHGQVQDMGHMDGKQKPSEDCMLKIACSAINAQLPVPMLAGRAFGPTHAAYSVAASAAYRSHQIAPPLSPPRLFA